MEFNSHSVRNRSQPSGPYLSKKSQKFKFNCEIKLVSVRKGQDREGKKVIFFVFCGGNKKLELREFHKEIQNCEEKKSANVNLQLRVYNLQL